MDVGYVRRNPGHSYPPRQAVRRIHVIGLEGDDCVMSEAVQPGPATHTENDAVAVHGERHGKNEWKGSFVQPEAAYAGRRQQPEALASVHWHEVDVFGLHEKTIRSRPLRGQGRTAARSRAYGPKRSRRGECEAGAVHASGVLRAGLSAEDVRP